MPEKIIIDTDPGLDDAIALLLAWASPELEVLGVTTVAGNVELDEAYKNAHRLRQLARQQTPIFSGCAAPLVKPLKTTVNIHGKEGLGIDWPELKLPVSSMHSVDFLIQQALAHKSSPITLCLLGPLTNLAAALEKCPQMVQGIKRVIIMGGSLNRAGNTSPYAEFNFFTDPHAAHKVFTSDLSILLCPLDATSKALMPEHWIEAIGKLDGEYATAVHGMLDVYFTGKGGGLHDPCVIAWLLKPELFLPRTCDVEIIESGEKEGLSMPEWHDKGRVTALMDVDTEGFFDLLYNRLAAADDLKSIK